MDHVPRMDWSVENQAETFKLFKQRMELYFKAKRIEEGEQVVHILLQVGDEGLRRYNSWSLTEEERKDPTKIFAKFVEQLEPCENYRISRLRLMHYRQRPEENLDCFINRCKLLALKCEFQDNELNERLIELIIAGTPIPDYQKELLGKNKNYTLDEAIQLGRAYEASASHVQQIRDMGTVATTAVHSFRRGANSSARCRNCGQQHPFKPRESCPAFGVECRACGRMNHWAKCCLTKKKQHANNITPHQRGRSKSRNRNEHRQRKHSYANEKTIHQMRSNAQNTDTLEQSFDALSFHDVKVSAMCLGQNNRDEAYAQVQIKLSNRPGIHNLSLKVDTGAQGNTLPLRTFRRMYPDKLNAEGFPVDNIVAAARGARLTAYNGTSITCHGVVNISCSYHKSAWGDTRFYIVDVTGPAVIGLQSCEKLKLVTLHCTIKTHSSTEDRPATGQSAVTSTASINSVDDLTRMYPEQFDRIGCFPGEVKLVVDPAVPPRVNPPRKTPIALKDAIKSSLDSMVENDVIRKVHENEPTEWVSSLAYAKKKDGSLRICLDPKFLNQALKRPHHKTPTLEELNHKFTGARYLSKLDAKAGYWGVQLHKDSQLLTTFQSPYGRYAFKRLPFGLSASQDIFQSRMDMILEQCDGAEGIADDVVVYGATEDEHDRNLHQLMNIASRNGLVFNSSKCLIKESSVSFFGLIYGIDGIKPDPDRIRDLQDIPPPRDKKELQQFLGLMTFLSPFIPNLADKASMLRDLLKEDSMFMWEPHHQSCFDGMKHLVTSRSSLQYFNVSKTPILQTDASLLGLGAALLQENESGVIQPVAYASKSLSSAEKRYACIERELLAIVFGTQRFHTYLYGRKFKVVTDHKPLVAIIQKGLVNSPPRLQRMLLKLQGYDMEVEYQPGKDIVLADTLSRLPSTHNTETIDLDVRVDFVRFSDERIQELRNKTKADPVLQALSETIVTGWPEAIKELPTSIRSYWSFRDELSVEDGILLKGTRVVIPESMQTFILEKLHYGHLGIEKTRLRAKDSVYWININRDIETTVKSCDICQEHQPAQQHETLQPHEVPSRPWEVVGTDMFFFNDADWLIIADYYSKFPIVRKMPKPCLSSTVVSVTKQIFSETGVPMRVVSDNGPHFASASYTDLSKKMAFQHVTSSPRYPRSNGFIERQIQTVKHVMKKARQSGQDLDLALLCLRTTPIDSKLPSPAELLNGRKIQSTLLTKIVDTRQDHDDMRTRLQERQDKMTFQHDQHARDLPPLHNGQEVRFRDQDGRWRPATVLDKTPNPRSYILTTPSTSTIRRNRNQIRDNSTHPIVRRVSFASPTTVQPAPAVVDSTTPTKTTDGSAENIVQNNTTGLYVTRSGRHIKQPQRYA